MTSLSALVVAHNEEENLLNCLNALQFADEVVVVLDKCTDGSKNIAVGLGCKIIEGSWPIEGVRRMAGIHACSSQWILEIDADERVSEALATEIRQVVNISTAQQHLIPIDNYIGKRLVKNGWGGSFGCRYKKVLFQEGFKFWGNQRVHPVVTYSGKQGERLENAIAHYVDKNLTETFARLNSYTTAKALDMVEAGRIGKQHSHIRRFFSRFWLCYVRRKGYKESYYGLVIALCAGLFPIISYWKAREILEDGH